MGAAPNIIKCVVRWGIAATAHQTAEPEPNNPESALATVDIAHTHPLPRGGTNFLGPLHFS
jgi:hypothetical protein